MYDVCERCPRERCWTNDVRRVCVSSIYTYIYDVERFEVGKRRRNASPYFVWVEKWSRVEGRRVEKHTLSKWK